MTVQDLPQTTRWRYEREFILRRVARRDLVTMAQPIVEVGSGRVVAYEALTRWPVGSAPSRAAELFAAAARTELLPELEAVARECALSRAVHWPCLAKLFLNCTPQCVASPDLVGGLLRALDGVEMPPQQIVIEITERFGEAESQPLERGVERLRRAGFGIALDDFGAGTNTLARLLEIRPEWVKLDRALVSGIHTDPVRESLVEGLARFARDAGMRVVAEGIEHEAELRVVRTLGIRYAQGFHLGMPRRAELLRRAA